MSQLSRKDLTDTPEQNTSPKDDSNDDDFDMRVFGLRKPVGVLSALNEEIQDNWVRIPAGASMWWLNGRVLNEGEMSGFGLVPCSHIYIS